MSNKNQLCLNWGQDSFFLVEAMRERIVGLAQTLLNTPLESESAEDIPEGLRYTGILQKMLREQGTSTKNINLSLPTKDLIFRSFPIPWMQPAEIKNVVSFEITKYIPIKMEELASTYHAVPYTENNQKNLRILFVAIRKDVLEHYTSVLEHTGLLIGHIEPACVSLVRALKKQRVIASRQCNAIIHLEENRGEIIIVADDVVQFVREFQAPTDQLSVPAVQAGFFNDVRVSFNYFGRQNSQSKVGKIILLSETDLSFLKAPMSDEFEAPVTVLTPSHTVKGGAVNRVGLLAAYGNINRDENLSTKDFELSNKSALLMQKLDQMEGLKGYRVTAGLIAFCLLCVFLTTVFSKNMTQSLKSKITAMEEAQGRYSSMKTNEIKDLTKELDIKFKSYQAIKTSSEITHFLQTVPSLLPQGAWLTNMKIEYVSNRASDNTVTISTALDLDGHVYLQEVNQQFRVVNNLVAMLKENEFVKTHFTKVDLLTVRQENLGEFKVTTFKITCR